MYYFIVNPKSKSGRGLAVWNNVKQALDEKHIEYSYFVTTHKWHATKFAKELCLDVPNRKYIIVVGGDGTVNEVINGIDDYSNIILGYIPTGKNNDLAKGLGIPSNPLDALNKIINTQRYIKVDHGITTLIDDKSQEISRKFSTSTGIGLDANICNEAIDSRLRNTLTKFKLGWLSYFIITFKQVLTLKLTDATIIADGIEKKYTDLAFAASLIQKRDGGLCLAPKARFNDQKLSICIVHGLSKLRIFYLLPTLLFGKHLNIEGVEVFECSTIEIFTDKKLIVHVDGEYAGRSNHIKNSCIPTQIKMPH